MSKSDIEVKNTITVSIKGTQHELTQKEAESLLNCLERVLGKKENFIPSNPIPRLPKDIWKEDPDPYKIWYSSRTEICPK